MNELSDQLCSYIEKLPKRAVINLFSAALDEMQGYNGQSLTSAICRTMGAEEIDSDGLAFHSLRRISIDNPGMSYLMELSIRDWNKQLEISDELKRATELFHESYLKK